MTPPAEAGHRTETTVLRIILAVALGHGLNDLMQSLIPAAYPLLKQNLTLSFSQVGLITLVFQGTASLLQPLVGRYTDRRPQPYAMAAGMASTGTGLVMLAQAGSFGVVLMAVALIGLGSSIFHPEASRITRLAAGNRPGFAQALFQVGGNCGSALGPLAAAFIVVQKGQTSIEWFALVALSGMVLLWAVGRWYITEGASRALARRRRAGSSQPVPKAAVRRGIVLLVFLMLAKFVYNASISSYLTFYLIEQYGLTVTQSQLWLFVYLALVALGTIIGGPIGDRFGRQVVIRWSILGILPLTLLVPWLPLVPAMVTLALAGLILASAFPAMVVYAQDLMPQSTGMVAGLLFGLAFGMGALGAAGLGFLADHWGIVRVYQITAFLPLLGLVAFLLPDPKA